MPPFHLHGVRPQQLVTSLYPGIKPLTVATLRDGRYFQPTFAVIDADDRVLHDYTQGWHKDARHGNYIFTEIRLPKTRRLRGSTLLLDVRSHSANYFHWMIEALPKFGFLERAGIDRKEIDHILFTHQPHVFQEDTLRALGVSKEATVDARTMPHVECDRLICVSDTREFLYPAAQTFLRDTLLPLRRPADGPATRIFISRRDAPKRRILNEAELEPLLRRHRVSVVTLADKSLAEQIALFARAELVIAPHGAGLANLAFCDPGTSVMELHFPSYTKGLFWRIASALGLNYGAIAGYGSPSGGQDMHISPHVLRDALEAWAAHAVPAHPFRVS